MNNHIDKHSDLVNPVPWLSIPSMLASNCDQYAKRSAIVDGDIHLSYEQLASEVDSWAATMVSLGVVKDDPVCIWAPNSWQWICCAFACWQLGAVVIPISSRLKAREVGPSRLCQLRSKTLNYLH